MSQEVIKSLNGRKKRLYATFDTEGWGTRRQRLVVLKVSHNSAALRRRFPDKIICEVTPRPDKPGTFRVLGTTEIQEART